MVMLLGVSFALVLGCGREAGLKELSRGSNESAVELFKNMAETEKGNIVKSPYSIRQALAMICAGDCGGWRNFRNLLA
jgi:serine protease inhibitor